MLKKWMPLLVLTLLMGIAYITGLHKYLSLSELIRQRAALSDVIASNFLVSIFVYTAIYVILVALSVPGATFLTLAGGLLFGWFLGSIATVIAATLGASVIFAVAKSSLGEALRAKGSGFIDKLRDGFQENAFSYMLFLRLTPAFPFFVVNLVPALLQVRFPIYFVATFLGIIPATVAYSIAGSGLDSVIAAQEKANPGCANLGTCQIDISSLVTPQLTIGLFALAAISLTPPLIARIRRSK